MTEPDDNSNTRPISVAELLAKNGTIGAPPVGGRRRRRRGNSDAVTVAELTGEIPIIRDDETSHRASTHAPVRDRDAEPAAPEIQPVEPVTNGAAPEVETEAEVLQESPIALELPEDPTTDVPEDAEPGAPAITDASSPSATDAPTPFATEAEADYAAHLEQRDVDPDPLDFAPPPRRPQVGAVAGFASATGFDGAGSGAEQMSPDPVIDDDDAVDLGQDVDFNDVLDKHAGSGDEGAAKSGDVPSYLRSGSDTLFGGQSVADDLARRGAAPGPEDIDLGDGGATRSATKTAAPSDSGTEEGSAFVRGVWIVAQCILAVAFGAGLFIAFDQLWRWNTIVALVLSVLVILGLVVGVRVVRKTEDIGSTLIAVAVGALVTLGPLALLQSH
jgi:hypothetical protein